MRNRRRLWLTLTLLIAIGGLAGPRPVAEACSIAGYSMMGEILGVSLGTSTPNLVPANAASINSTRGEAFVSGGATLYRIPAGTASVDAGSGVVIPVSGTPDTVAPTLTLNGAVWMRSTGCSGCAYGGSDTSAVTLDVVAGDDAATAAQISYAVYFGDTEADAVSASEGEPELWVLPTMGSTLSVWFFLTQAELSPFVVVRAFDQAGNASAASAPTRVTNG